MSDIVTATDGVTSIPATRQLTSATNFISSGVRIGDILHIEDTASDDDNNRYYITAVATNTITVSKDWPVGSLTSLTFRVQQINQKFSALDPDYTLLSRMDKEAFWRLYTPRTWWVLNQLSSSNLNIYGEPVNMDITTGTDGVTSIPATRQFTSASVDFISLNVRPLETIVIDDTSTPGDDGEYQIVSVDSTHQVTVSKDWPVGSGSSLSFTVRNPYHEYDPFETLVPFMCRLEPTEDDLKKWGIDEPRDAVITLSIALCEDIGLAPKIGDRFDVYSEDKLQQFQILTLDKIDINNDMKRPLHYVGTCVKTKYYFTEA